MRDDGRMFFTSAEALVPQDTNGKEDVYEYEPAGVGGCTTESETYGEESEGCVSLISSGVSEHESAFLDASASGNDVFFVTEEKLAPADTDTNFDVYDATVCGQPGTHECLPAPAISPPPCDGLESTANTLPLELHRTRCPVRPPGEQGRQRSTNSAQTEVLGETVTRETNAQKLAKALKACKKASKSKRAKCERTAILKYGTKAQKLSASLKACHKVTNHKKRKACERLARKKYGTAKKVAHHAEQERPMTMSEFQAPQGACARPDGDRSRWRSAAGAAPAGAASGAWWLMDSSASPTVPQAGPEGDHLRQGDEHRLRRRQRRARARRSCSRTRSRPG